MSIPRLPGATHLLETGRHRRAVARSIALVRQRSAADGYPLGHLTDEEIRRDGITWDGGTYRYLLPELWATITKMLRDLTVVLQALADSAASTTAALDALGDFDLFPEFSPYCAALADSGLFLLDDYERIAALIRMAQAGARDNFMSLALESMPRVTADVLYRRFGDVEQSEMFG